VRAEDRGNREPCSHGHRGLWIQEEDCECRRREDSPELWMTSPGPRDSEDGDEARCSCGRGREAKQEHVAPGDAGTPQPPAAPRTAEANDDLEEASDQPDVESGDRQEVCDSG
jgi:hypothetical protein